MCSSLRFEILIFDSVWHLGSFGLAVLCAPTAFRGKIIESDLAITESNRGLCYFTMIIISHASMLARIISPLNFLCVLLHVCVCVSDTAMADEVKVLQSDRLTVPEVM